MNSKKAKQIKRTAERAVDKNKRIIIQNFMDDWMSTPEAIGWYHARVYVKRY